ARTVRRIQQRDRIDPEAAAGDETVQRGIQVHGEHDRRTLLAQHTSEPIERREGKFPAALQVPYGNLRIQRYPQIRWLVQIARGHAYPTLPQRVEHPYDLRFGAADAETVQDEQRSQRLGRRAKLFASRWLAVCVRRTARIGQRFAHRALWPPTQPNGSRRTTGSALCAGIGTRACTAGATHCGFAFTAMRITSPAYAQNHNQGVYRSTKNVAIEIAKVPIAKEINTGRS